MTGPVSPTPTVVAPPTAASATDTPTPSTSCSQCPSHDSRGCEHPLHGCLCHRCAYRQAEHDDRADGIDRWP